MERENLEKAILAGGCFWGMQELLRKVPGIITTRAGYTGGKTSAPTYNDMKSGGTGHAESLEITFDPQRISYRNILLFFFQIHDPTTRDRQGNDRGSQYRSAIFYTSEDQRAMAEKVIAEIDASKVWPAKVVTEVTKASTFFEAEDYHQDYLQKNPGGYTCHFIRPNWKLLAA